MQGRMKRHQLTKEEIETLLLSTKIGRIATQNENGFPYITPVHYVLVEGKIYIHGLSKGQKISNIAANDMVCFEVEWMGDLVFKGPSSCNTNTNFESVVIFGTAAVIADMDRKREILKAIVQKYTPELVHLEFPDNMMKATAVIEITPVETTGKYYRHSS